MESPGAAETEKEQKTMEANTAQSELENMEIARSMFEERVNDCETAGGSVTSPRLNGFAFRYSEGRWTRLAALVPELGSA